MSNIRNIRPEDFPLINSVLDSWWGGRKMSHLLPRLFFDHFSNTSFIIEGDEGIRGFIIGFVSQIDPALGYVHFVGVNPLCRKQGTGRQLYQLFIDKMKELGVKKIECITSPVNQQSVNFHQKIGFRIKQGDCKTESGIPFTSSYDGPEEDRVLFSFVIDSSSHIIT